MNDDLNETPMTDEEIAAEKESVEAQKLERRRQLFAENLERFKLRKCMSREEGKTHYLKRDEQVKTLIKCAFCGWPVSDKNGLVIHEV